MRPKLKYNLFDFTNYFVLILLCLTILFPFYHLAISSLSASDAAVTGLWSNDFTLYNYQYVLSNKFIWIGYRETLFRMSVGTLLCLFMTILGAYPLSKKEMPHRTLFTVMILIPMFFSGGLIPVYLLINNLNLINNRFSLILPGLVSPFNLIIMRNFFMSIPVELEDSARIDGASRFKTLTNIVLPISKPILATIALWLAVGHWNAWFDVLIYIRDPNKYVLQIVLRRILMEGTQEIMDLTPSTHEAGVHINPGTIRAATIYISTMPILMIYPFIQKYFVKGIMVGSLKG